MSCPPRIHCLATRHHGLSVSRLMKTPSVTVCLITIIASNTHTHKNPSSARTAAPSYKSSGLSPLRWATVVGEAFVTRLLPDWPIVDTLSWLRRPSMSVLPITRQCECDTIGFSSVWTSSKTDLVGMSPELGRVISCVW